jgi:hypothetical protein
MEDCKNSMSASSFALNWEKNATETFKTLEVPYGEQIVGSF